MAKRTAQRSSALSASPCPCGLGEAYRECCGMLHQGQAAATAEQLMRSRYSAFVVHDTSYLLRTWSAQTRPENVRFDNRLRWTGLEVLGSTGGSAFHTEGTVEFRAHYVIDGTPGEQHENSRFLRENGEWVFDRAIRR